MEVAEHVKIFSKYSTYFAMLRQLCIAHVMISNMDIFMDKNAQLAKYLLSGPLLFHDDNIHTQLLVKFICYFFAVLSNLVCSLFNAFNGEEKCRATLTTAWDRLKQVLFRLTF